MSDKHTHWTLESYIAHNEALRGAEKEARLEREAAAKEALEIQTDEVHRRLNDLNGEQSRLSADRERYLQKEVHEPWKAGIDHWREQVNVFIAGNSGRDKGLSLAWVVAVALIGMALSMAIYLKP